MLIGAVDLSLGLVVAGIVFLAGLALAAVWLVPKRQARRWQQAGIGGRELAELENGARSAVIQLVGGVALILTFVATWAQIADTRKTTEETLDLASVQQENERFTRAMDQLASQRLEMRVGAITGLGDIAQATAARREPVTQILITYLASRHPADLSPGTPLFDQLPPPECAGPHRTLFGRAAPDAQAALRVVLDSGDGVRRRYDLAALDLDYVEAPGAALDGANLSGSDLHGADLTAADFRGADLTSLTLDMARLDRARFNDARMSGVGLHRACAPGASLRNVDAFRSHLQGANLRGADLTGASFASSDLPGVSLAGATLRLADLNGADLNGADLTGASFRGTDLRGADLSGSKVTQEDLRAAETNECTRLPWRPRVPSRCLPAGSA